CFLSNPGDFAAFLPGKESIMNLQGKVALVTGAGSGIGKAAAIRLAREGARVALLGRTEGELEETADRIGAAGGESLVLLCDVSRAEDVKNAANRTAEAFGRIDAVVANAGINGVWAPIDELTPEEWDRTLAINLGGTYLTIHYTVPHLRRNGGSIVIISSINGTRTFTSGGATAYSASKAAQVAMAKQLAVELGKDRIRVNAICPGAIETSIDENTEKRNVEAAEIPVEWPEGDIPLTGGRSGTPEDVADLIAFLTSDQSGHITGVPIFIDGAQSLLR